MKPVIKVEHLGKKYIIRHQQQTSYVTLRDVLTNRAKSLGKKVLALSPGHSSVRPSKEEFWALKDVSFEVNQGDRIGIIGRNGAGKTTLLRVLSRITEPTTGRISLRGRMASLLEVGTGFHPELTGRENVFLNGAILGMTKTEIKRKFDEIVDFAEIEKFLDTPVKYYSSGMYVRLAFAVAAHLEPEILVVDEVLAVGDAQFQKKCLGKMEDVSLQKGRTVLFVSHNMSAVQQVCNRSMILSDGKLVFQGTTSDVIKRYLEDSITAPVEKRAVGGNGKILLDNWLLTDTEGNQKAIFFVGDEVRIHFTLLFKENVEDIVIAVEVKNLLGESFAHMVNEDAHFSLKARRKGDRARLIVTTPELCFTPGRYFLSLWVSDNGFDACDSVSECMHMDLLQGPFIGRSTPYPAHVRFYLKCDWAESE